MGVRKIEKRFEEEGIKLKYIDKRLVETPNGRRFYSDGTYFEDVYKINENYELHEKISGRHSYGLYNKITGEYEIRTFYQQDFLKEIDKQELIKNLKGR